MAGGETHGTLVGVGISVGIGVAVTVGGISVGIGVDIVRRTSVGVVFCVGVNGISINEEPFSAAMLSELSCKFSLIALPASHDVCY